ncbi:MAG: hypothetical protein U1E78_05755 [Gammaproteobacteria bacterium]
MSLQAIQTRLNSLLIPFKSRNRKNLSDRSLRELETKITNVLYEAIYDPTSTLKPGAVFKKWALCSHPDQKKRSRKQGKDEIPILSHDLISEINRIFSLSESAENGSIFFILLKNAYDMGSGAENTGAKNISIVDKIFVDLIDAGLHPYEYMASCRPFIFYRFPNTDTCFVGEPLYLFLYFIKLRVFEAVQNNEYNDDIRNNIINEFKKSQLIGPLKRLFGEAIFPATWLNPSQPPSIEIFSLGDGIIKYHLHVLNCEINKESTNQERNQSKAYFSLWQSIYADPRHFNNFGMSIFDRIEKFSNSEYQYEQYQKLMSLFSFNESGVAYRKRLNFSEYQIKSLSFKLGQDSWLRQATSWIYRHGPEVAIPKPGSQTGVYPAAYASKQGETLWDNIYRHPQTIGVQRFPQWLAALIYGLPIVSFLGSALFWMLHYEIYNVAPSNLFVTYVTELGLAIFFGIAIIQFTHGLAQAGLDTLAEFNETKELIKPSFGPDRLRNYYLKVIFPFLNVLQSSVDEGASYKLLLKGLYPVRVLLGAVFAIIATISSLAESIITNAFKYCLLGYFTIPNLWFDGPDYFKALRELPGKAYGVMRGIFNKNVDSEYVTEQNEKPDLRCGMLEENPSFFTQYSPKDTSIVHPLVLNFERTSPMDKQTPKIQP